MLAEDQKIVNHPAQWLAEATAKKFPNHPHMADIAQRGAEVVARGRVNLNQDTAANVRDTSNTALMAKPTVNIFGQSRPSAR